MYLNVLMSSLILISFCIRSVSSGSCCCLTKSLPRMTGDESPGHIMLDLPMPMIWPLFKFLALIFPVPFPRPLFRPALLTLVTPFHKLSAGTKIGIQMTHTFTPNSDLTLTFIEKTSQSGWLARQDCVCNTEQSRTHAGFSYFEFNIFISMLHQVINMN